MKSMTVPVAVAVAIVGCVLAVSANVTTTQMNRNLDNEAYKRMAAEKELMKAQAEIKKYQTELAAAQAKLQDIKSVLDKGQAEMKAKLDAERQEKARLMQEVEQIKNTRIPSMGENVPMETP